MHNNSITKLDINIFFLKIIGDDCILNFNIKRLISKNMICNKINISGEFSEFEVDT